MEKVNFNLTELFQVQQNLKSKIGYKEADKFEKIILALIVEVCEAANEWRGFKYWSQDQKPRLENENLCGCNCCSKRPGFPLIEEYVDGLHFVLEVGLDLLETEAGFKLPETLEIETNENVTDQFKRIVWLTLTVEFLGNKNLNYKTLLENYFCLGYSLGFTPPQIKEAYFSKNQVNHERQENGY